MCGLAVSNMPRTSAHQLAVHEILLYWQHTRSAYWRRRSSPLHCQPHPVSPESILSSSASRLSQASQSPSSASTSTSNDSNSSSDSFSSSSSSSLSSSSTGSSSHPTSRHSTSGSSIISTTSTRDMQELHRQQDTVACDHTSFTHTIRRIQSILHLLLSTHVLAPHEVSKCSQVGLVIELFKENDLLRFRQNLRVYPRCRRDISPMHKSPIRTGFDPPDVPCSLCI